MTTFLIIFVLSYLYHGLGITVGYHRLLSHRAFKCPAWLEYFIVSGGYLALEGSPVSWVATHRVHHRYSDREGDPHRPADGFWHAFAGWLYSPIVVLTGEQIEQTVPDLWRDPVYRFFDFNHSQVHALVCLLLSIGVRIPLFVFFGWAGLIANLLGTFMVFIGPFLVNSVCHIKSQGYRNFVTEDGSRNVWWVGLWALGEGWHNNHHAVPQSARHGITPREFDLSWLYISLLSGLGLATNVRLPKESKSAPCIEPSFASFLQANSGASPHESPEVQVARDELMAQLDAAKLLANKLAVVCDQLSDQVSQTRTQLVDQVEATKGQLTDQISNARAQLAEQLLSTCDQLADQLDAAKVQLAEQVRTARDQLSDALRLVQEAETA
jgi:stearoyl-CoA desaturase (delta-9 desaturase)